MHKENYVLGYHEFPVQSERVIHLASTTDLNGSKDFLKRDDIDITWVRVSEAITFLSFKEKIVKRIIHCHDAYNFLSSAEGLIEEAPEVAASWQIEPDSELEVRIVGWLIDIPTLGFGLEERNRKYYNPIQQRHIWRDVASVKLGEPLTFEAFPYEDRSSLSSIEHSSTIIWRSANSQEENQRAFADYRNLAVAKERSIIHTGVPIPNK